MGLKSPLKVRVLLSPRFMILSYKQLADHQTGLSLGQIKPVSPLQSADSYPLIFKCEPTVLIYLQLETWWDNLC